jgi:hypothetical protein
MSRSSSLLLRENLSQHFEKENKIADGYKKEELSRSEKGKQPWDVYNSKLKSYDESFARVLGYKKRDALSKHIITDYLKERFAGNEGQLRALELGGTGLFFHEIIDPQTKQPLFKKIAGVTLQDFEGLNNLPNDSLDRRKVIEGQIFEGGQDSIVKTKVKEWFANKGVDFIVERMVGGMYDKVIDLNFQFLSLSSWYDLLNVNGVMLVQIPASSPELTEYEYKNKLINWINFIRSNPSLSQRVKTNFDGDYALKIEKLKPGRLPRLRA